MTLTDISQLSGPLPTPYPFVYFTTHLFDPLNTSNFHRISLLIT